MNNITVENLVSVLGNLQLQLINAQGRIQELEQQLAANEEDKESK